jgi:hypothetical protein
MACSGRGLDTDDDLQRCGGINNNRKGFGLVWSPTTNILEAERKLARTAATRSPAGGVLR